MVFRIFCLFLFYIITLPTKKYQVFIKEISEGILGSIDKSSYLFGIFGYTTIITESMMNNLIIICIMCYLLNYIHFLSLSL